MEVRESGERFDFLEDLYQDWEDVLLRSPAGMSLEFGRFPSGTGSRGSSGSSSRPFRPSTRCGADGEIHHQPEANRVVHAIENEGVIET